MPNACPFCAIAAGEAPAQVLEDDGNDMIIVPLNPVVDGHVLVLPRLHVADATVAPMVTASTWTMAARWAAAVRRRGDDVNLITSAGAAATQTVPHMHVHVVPRRPGDGLHLPWTGQQQRRECTGMMASWCDVHGACTCPRDDEGGWLDAGPRDEHGCPLHDAASSHPIAS